MTSRVAAWLVTGTLVACTRTAPQPPSTSPAAPPTTPEATLGAGTAGTPGSERADAGEREGGLAEPAPATPTLPTAAAPPRFSAPHERTASPDDGAWTPLASHEGVALLYQSTVHPSPAKSQVKVTLIAADLARIALRLVAGTREPVAPGIPASARPGRVPTGEQEVLIAVTNGGWRSEHGHFGMRVGPLRFEAPKPGACTIGLDATGGLAIAPWEELAPRDAELVAWRQTPACLVHGGALHPTLVRETLTRRWGAAVDGNVEIPRTALGVDATGRYALFGMGESTSAKALADAMLVAGSKSAAELDINWSYTRFSLFGQATKGGPVTIVRSLGTKGQHPPTSYVGKSSERDFFYLVRKAP